jgi:hypothetical protein
MRMRQRRITLGKLRHRLHIVAATKYAQRADTHHGTICLALAVRPVAKSGGSRNDGVMQATSLSCAVEEVRYLFTVWVRV